MHRSFRETRFPAQALCAAVCVFLGCSPRAAFGTGAAWPKLEASFNLNGLTTDAFDYTQTDVMVQISQPDGSVISLPAFFDGGTTWRVRHTPGATGPYRVTGVTLNGSAITPANLQPASWSVAGPAPYAGFVQVDPANPRRFITSNGRRFFPVGHDVAWWTNNAQLPGAFFKMGAAHEDWSRVWMMHFYDSLNLEWPQTGSLGDYSLSVAQKWDAIVSAADQAGIHFQMTLQHHGQYASTNGSDTDPNWEQNPYNAANGGFLTNATQFFTDASAQALTMRKYRYIIARWGYSPGILAWELFNEVQYTDAGYYGQWTNIGAWHDEMATFIRQQDAYHHLITTSSDLTEPIWDQTDYYQHHDYPTDLIDGIRNAEDITSSQRVGPDYSGECGIDFTPHVGVSPPVWAGLMAGQSGGAMPWYWDTIDPNNDYGLLRAASDFVAFSGLGDQDAVTQSVPQVTGGALTALSFGFGGGWSTATQDTFTVGSTAPNGSGSAPSYLQGTYHRAMTPNGYTFLVNYPQAGTFSVQIVTVAASGAGLTISLDDVATTNITFPSASSDVSTNFVATIAVGAGAHSINLYNPGLDWVNLGNITLNPYADLLGAYAVGNSNFNATWIWNRTNVFASNASISATAAVTVTGLNPGTYSATWWDTFAGAASSNFTLTVPSGGGTVTVTTPPVLRSTALYVGLPARAAITAPYLTQAALTNGLAVTVPLIMTNLGGVPLTYSLCVTGASPLVYAAMNSTQVGSPVYAWKDISSVGQDITGNFTALAAPKSAEDEGIAGPIGIGFGFPFFNGSQTPASFSQLYVSPNGFVAFSPFAGNTGTNTAFPSASAPANAIAVFWEDLILTNSASHVYTFLDSVAGEFIVQFDNAQIKGSSAMVTCQLALKTTGEILMQYQSLSNANTCTVGLQNAARTQGLTVAFDQNVLQTNFALLLSPVPWLECSSSAGTVPGSRSESIDLIFNPAGLGVGTYSAVLQVNTGDPLLPVTTLPVSLSVLSVWPAAPQLQTTAGSPGQFVFRLQGQSGLTYIVQTSTDLKNWTSLSTNLLASGGVSITNGIVSGPGERFWRALWQP